jgi:murein DD-endopeptidase MepM/ murein hydrolase activator NlpD
VFGKRREPHTVIIAHGDQIRHFTVHPWMAAIAGSVLAAIAVGYLLATSYLVLRDDLIGAAVTRQARIQQAYEDRISALRAQVDRITSRQLLDQQIMENKVSELLARQSVLSQRHGRIGPILERAASETGLLPAAAPVPAAKPEVRADAGARPALAYSAPTDPLDGLSLRAGGTGHDATADRADKLFVAINQSLRAIEGEQLTKIATLAENATETADKIAQALEDAGLEIDVDYGKQGIGGPLVAPDPSTEFDTRVRELDEALDHLEAMKMEARRYPIANPAPGVSVSSGFGIRRDPLLGTPAMHAGIDFRGTVGSPARATAKGTVVKAGWNGGYGRMVEIDHGDGFTTRYAHLSKVLVNVGDKVDVGDIVGKVGSSGRSTGPHLHYEVRKNGDAINPLRLLKAGRKVSTYL